MQCTCVRQTDLPNTSKLYSDLIYHFDRVADLYPWAPNDIRVIARASQFHFPDDRRAALISAMAPLNEGNPSLGELARPGTVAIVTGQQVGLFSGPAYTVYKALTAIRIARDLASLGVPAVPVFWLATEDHDFAEIDHTWVFGPDHRPVRIDITSPPSNGTRPVGGLPLGDIPIDQLKAALGGMPFAEEAAAMVARAYRPGETMGSAFANFVRELFAPYGLLLIDPMSPAIRAIVAPLMREAVERMPELTEALIERGRELTARGYHAQVLVDNKTSLAFLLEDGHRLALRRSGDTFAGPVRKYSSAELAACAERLSPNALLRPVIQDYLLPTAAYIGGPAELAYLAQSQVLYAKLLSRQPVAFPRTGFTLLEGRFARRIARYKLNPADLFVPERILRERVARQLIPPNLGKRLEATKDAFSGAFDALEADLRAFDVSLASALGTSRRKIEYQAAKIARKTEAQMLLKNEQAQRDTASLHGLVYPEDHLQERLYSIVPFLAQFGPGLISEIYGNVRVDCPDHQFATL